ncbi:SAC1 [Symbiodinium necroappetens]|uniref:SAC1 protein n=1 Tax=Symbiodinium necroappetens TaxID=1628268 RepID=A0A812PX68_9DINO|nr:SAC1 [Symbiodinium necroappetens]
MPSVPHEGSSDHSMWKRTTTCRCVSLSAACLQSTARMLQSTTDSCAEPRQLWNHYHMTPFFANEGWQHWCLSIIHGFFAHTKCSSFGWTFEVALIARRSRFYAGTRYRKRGLNVDGQVGNDVETEQLLCDDSLRHLSTGHVMSFVQIRGSVPLFWSQEATAINPKPPVVYPRCDPTLSATRRHFADLLERYGTPQLVVNLMKAKKVNCHPRARLFCICSNKDTILAPPCSSCRYSQCKPTAKQADNRPAQRCCSAILEPEAHIMQSAQRNEFI